MDCKYGYFSQTQISAAKESMRKQIYFLLLIVDPRTRNDYSNVNIDVAFDTTLRKFGGFNSVLNESPELVWVISLLEAALIEYHSDSFNYATYRKLVLDAGNEVLKIKEV